jgi:prevent-host-death family protein
MATSETISATEFKAKCLEILDRVGSRAVQRVAITKRGAVVAVLVPPDITAEEAAGLHGFMRGSVVIPPGFDLTAPVIGDEFDAADGMLHG